MKFIYHYDIAALLISIVILCNVFFKQRIKTRVSKSFKILAIDLFLSIIFDLITIFSITYYTYFPVWLNYILNIICLLTYNLLPVFYISSIVCATTEEDDPILRKSKIIISSIVKMAKALDMTVITEGVETKENVDFLNNLGVDIFQGYYYSKPLSIEDFEQKYLEEQK